MPAELSQNDTQLWEPVFQLIREVSPATLLGPKKGDYCQSNGGRYTLYVNNGPVTNSTDSSYCTFRLRQRYFSLCRAFRLANLGSITIAANRTGDNFSPLESHGVTIQEGPDGNTDGALPSSCPVHLWCMSRLHGLLSLVC